MPKNDELLKFQILDEFFKAFPGFEKSPETVYKMALLMIEWVRNENAKELRKLKID